MEEILKKESGSVHIMEICLGGNWVYARDGPLRLSGNFLSWIQAGRSGRVFGWKILDGP